MKLISYLQNNFGMSRRSVVGLINRGSIFLNGKIIESYKEIVEKSDIIEIKNYKYKKIIVNIYEKSSSNLLIFNKPKGYVVSKSDVNNKTIYEILPKKFENYYYIGRLDKDSHGLLLMTNDSKLVNKFSHPSNEIEKEYIVNTDYDLNNLDIAKCLKGLYDDLELLKFKYIYKISSCLYKVVLIEGKKRHIRRVFDNLGYKVLDLQRIREGQFDIGDLTVGAYKLIKIDNLG